MTARTGPKLTPLEKAYRYREKHRKLGLCLLCPKPAVLSGLCLRHAVENRERGRKRNKSTRRYNSASYRLEKQLAQES